VVIDDIVKYDIVTYMKYFLSGLTMALCLAATTVGLAQPLEQRTASFTVHVNGSVTEVTPLFGPVRESGWAPTWKPRFLHPAEGGQREGAVFTAISADGRERLWLVTNYDVESGRVEYVFVSPGFTAAHLKIAVSPDGPGKTKVAVIYRYSALSEAGNDEVRKVDSKWAEQHRAHWQSGLDQLAQNSLHHD
jgi:hypothetical protein